MEAQRVGSMSREEELRLVGEEAPPGARSPGLYVGIAALDETGWLVLVRRSNSPARGMWALPIGYVEPGETPEQAVVREAREETGLEVAIDELLCEYVEQGLRLIIYRGRVTGGHIAAGDDATDARFFNLEEIPVDQAAVSVEDGQGWAVRMNGDIFRTLQRQLARPSPRPKADPHGDSRR